MSLNLLLQYFVTRERLRIVLQEPRKYLLFEAHSYFFYTRIRQLLFDRFVIDVKSFSRF